MKLIRNLMPHFVSDLFIVSLFVSCGNGVIDCDGDDTENLLPNGMHEVVLTLKSLENQATDFFRAANPDNSALVDLHYIVYLDDYFGNIYQQPPTIKSKKFNISQGANLIIRDTLPSGRYTVALVACTAETDNWEYVFNASREVIGLPFYTADVFYDSFEVIADENVVNISKDVTLSRIVGKLEVVIKDASELPQGINWVLPRIGGCHPRLFNVRTQETVGMTVNPNIDLATHIYGYPGWMEDGFVSRTDFTANKEYVISLYMLDNTELSGTTDLSIWGTEDQNLNFNNTSKVLFNKLVMPDVKIQRNKVTRLTGYLFDDAKEWTVTHDEIPDSK